MEAFFNNKSIFSVLNKWKIHLAIVAVAAIILGALISSPIIIKPKFKSFTVLYPVNLPVVSEESQTEQMLQLIQSTDIRNRVFKAMDIAKHYEIDTNSNKYWMTDLITEWESNVSFRKTEYESVEIEALDTDPVIASKIVDSLIHFYNKKVQSLHRSKSQEVVVIAKTEKDKKKRQIDSLEKHLKFIRDTFGILDYKIQTREYSRASYGGRESKEMQSLVKNLKEKGGEYMLTDSMLWSAMKYYNQLQIYYENNIRDVQKELTYAHLVSTPYPADKKTYPVRWVIVLMTTISSLILAVIAIIFIESKRTTASVKEEKTKDS
ncbi:MAG: hypothetical protein A2275_00585 [Bacteroidetes bacterium RIFOXYA12_FULL_35_11]|nr:MAG: hypothetical protein A2X01_08935 [Bacteroidetes bacterium GWF2_35_48]OFY72992.1 MAG: hypothetical protein A2275_00585 [Bacteroidetes bacterium RIFOXYA12_FULL_35_11]OFY92096.1 MAG: hypothetical protein A2309_09415 [Bacteroidetes bacterium RIFOXYB2_FULL_35_7]OFY93890.1 MAG: hypothetical protein A2491_11765 [Bacteroidetes bacterium RIFOXYC12_FULL_35_7]HBX51852.1 hypothetical protein [Bacteroidales bacterium]